MSTSSGELTVVSRRKQEALDICAFELRAVHAPSLPAFSAGSHIDVHRRFTETVFPVHSDPSESSLPDRRPEGREGRRLGGRMHEQLHPGDDPTSACRAITLPSGQRFPSPTAGCGRDRCDTGPLWRAACQPGRRFRDALLRLALGARGVPARASSNQGLLRVCFHFDDGSQNWRSTSQRCTRRQNRGCILYVCRPKRFHGRHPAPGARERGCEDQCTEFFASKDHSFTRRQDDGSFSVKLASSGRVIPVRSRPERPPQALNAAGVGVVTSACEQIVCGTCVTHVLEGIPDHRDMYFTPQEQAR